MPNLQNLLQPIVAAIAAITIGYANATNVRHDGHIYCRVSNGTERVELPVKNAQVILMEEDCWFLIFLLITWAHSIIFMAEIKMP
jgi:hypothetical protein